MPLFRRNSKKQTEPSTPSNTESAAPDSSGQVSIRGGRRYRDDVPYLLPKDLAETNRLDLQHHIMRQMLKSNYVAPIGRPGSILDVGCGTGRWAYEMCREFPEAQVTGLDLEEVSNSQERPPTYRFVPGNIFQDLPFKDNMFDYTHQRFLSAAIILARWPHVAHELVRVTRPGGWVEMVEAGTVLVNAGPTYDGMMEVGRPYVEKSGIPLTQSPPALEHYLADEGVVDVKTSSIDLPVGIWGGKLGGMLAADLRSAIAGAKDLYPIFTQMTAEDFDAMLSKVMVEWNEHHAALHIMIAYGRKPE